MSKEVDRDREERRLCKKYNILFRGPAHPWPKDHTRAFQHVSILGKYFFSDYVSQNDGLETGEKRWKSSTIGRAKRLVETASRLQGTQPSELKWRLDLEKIIYGRFELEIECPEPRCRGRLWRSEIEVVSEIEDSIIGKSISERQQARVPCQCNAEAILKNHNNIPLNQVFADRVDNFVIHGGEAASELRPRKPDRVYGLQQTKRFQGVLGDIVRVIENRTEKKIDITPFDDSTDPIIFPFLISEAKSEKGDSFEACERQSAFPIWKLLCLQEGLEKESKRPLVEQGGPLVWFLANRGEDWRVYGCYIKSQTEIDRTSYNIHNLWSGRVDSLDGALQLLLIMDYIFDWARDLYRSGIYRQLESLTAENFSETRSIASDSDIYSLRPLDGKSSKSVPVHLSSHLIIDFGEGNTAQFLISCGPQANKSFRAVEPQLSESNREQAMPMPDLMQWKNFDEDHGVFRPGNLITNSFECVHVTTSNLESVLWSLAKKKSKDAARTLYNLFYFHPFLVSERFLDSLETAWTGTERHSPHAPNLEPQKTIVALFTYRVRFSRDWGLTRYLTCLAFDAAAFALTSVLSGYKSQPSSGVFYSERISETEIQKLSICLQADSPIDYFVHAMNQKTKTIVKLKDPTQNFDLVSSVNSLKVIDAVGKIWRSDLGSNPFGFADTARRFSTKSFTLSGQKMSPRSSSSSGPEVLSACQIVLKENRSILFHSEPCEGGVWRRKKPVPPFCLFVLCNSPEAPNRRSQIDLLHEVIRNGKVFFTCHETNNPYSSALRKEEYEVVNNDQTLWKMTLSWYRSILFSWKWPQPQYRAKKKLGDLNIDPIHGLPIIDLEDPEFLALRERTDAMMELGSSDEESDETSISFVKKESRSRRESLDVVVPVGDKEIWKELKRHFV